MDDNNQIQEQEDEILENEEDTYTLEWLTLSLSFPDHHGTSSSAASNLASATIRMPPPPYLYYSPLVSVNTLPESGAPENRPTPSLAIPRPRRNPTGTPPPGKPATFPPPYPWAGDRRCIVHTLTYLRSQNILVISGDGKCKKCEQAYTIQYNLEEKCTEIFNFIHDESDMNDRAPRMWMSPALPNCLHCKESNSVRPVMSDKKKKINWLFLFLGQMVGCCTLNQLKYYCKHNSIHRTGAKDRLVFYTYMHLCHQLQPQDF
ncbi:hypothetical protein ACS0TY_001744 [Phlomoides rotata]